MLNFNQLTNLVSKFSPDRERNVMDGLYKLTSNSGRLELTDKSKVYSGFNSDS